MVAARSGRILCISHRNRFYFYTGPDPTGTQTWKGILKHVQTMSVKEELPRKGDPETRGRSQHRDYDSLPHNGEAMGIGATIMGT